MDDTESQRGQAIKVLRELLDASFTEDELGDLCLGCLPKAYPSYPHQADKPGKISYLISYAMRQG